MGELSRAIGIAGEQIVISSFLKLVGWNPAMDGLDIDCSQQRKHERKKHGIDGFMSYECPLSLYTQENIYISAKYESKVRHNKANILKYVNDLLSAGECFKYSERYKEITSNQEFVIKEKKHSHVIFCLSHDSDDDTSAIKEFKAVYDDIVGETDGVYLVDNQRMKFLYMCIKSIKEQIANTDNKYEFCYHPTGVNESYNNLAQFSGKILPVQFINSPVIAVKLKSGKVNSLLLYVRENFDKEVFKRVIGLAQGLTNGWGNKVVIYFPDYTFKNKIDKESVLISLKDRDFASIVQLSTYSDSFKILEEDIDDNYIDKYEMKDHVNVDSLLPFGEKMRQLISQPYIDKRDLHTVLKRRGVIVKKNWNKHDMVPIFRKIILSPTEFEYLKLRQVTKEYAEKRTSREIRALHSDVVSLISEEKIAISEIISKKTDGCVLVSSSLTRRDGDVVFSYQVQKQDISRDWSNVNSTYKGEVVFRNSVPYLDAYKNNVSMIYDSADTRVINKAVFESVLHQLESEGAAQKMPPIIMFSSELTDENRNNFLLSIAEISPKDSSVISFKDVISVETVFMGVKSKDMPLDLVEYMDRVKQSSFEGNNIHQLKYLKNAEYSKFFIVKEVVAEFSFSIGAEQGVFKVEYGYPAYKGDSEGQYEFEFKVISVLIQRDENIARRLYQEIEATLKDEFDRIILLKYNSIDKKYGVQTDFMNELKA